MPPDAKGMPPFMPPNYYDFMRNPGMQYYMNMVNIGIIGKNGIPIYYVFVLYLCYLFSLLTI